MTPKSSNNNSQPLRCAIYIRPSSEHVNGCPERQVAICRAAARAHGWYVPAEQEQMLPADNLDDRARLRALVEAVARPHSSLSRIIVTNVWVLGQDFEELAHVLDLLHVHGRSVHFAGLDRDSRHVDFDTAFQFMRQLVNPAEQ